MATPVESEDDQPAWTTTLRAQIGPLARSKQLRFVRVVDETDTGSDTRRIRFERRELDGREHAQWVMEATVHGDSADDTLVTLDLSYSGGLWMPALGNVLGGAMERATVRLSTYVHSHE